MILTIEGTYKDGKVEWMETPVGVDQAGVLVTFLPKNVPAEKKPQPLLGAWEGAFPEDSDIDAVLLIST